MLTQINLYETDFYAWTQEQKRLLAEGKFDQLDIPNLIEEIDSLGKQQQSELRNRLGILLGHLLKWHYQPSHRCKSWLCTIEEQRERIIEHLEDNPSLKSHWSVILPKAYKDGLRLVKRETPLALPQTCPFTEYQMFDEVIELC